MKTKLLGSVAVAASLLAVPTPALATVDATFGGADLALDLACDALLKPADASDYTTYAYNVHVTAHSGPVTIDDPAGTATFSGLGTPTTTISNYRGAHVNGKSVNIHAYGDQVVTYPNTLKTIPTITTTSTTTSASCHVHKPTNGNAPTDLLHHDYVDPVTGIVQNYEAPPGLQTIDEAQTVDTVVSHGTRTETLIGVQYIDPNASVTGAEFVICISPSTTTTKGNPGAWRGANGYTNQIEGKTCSTAWHDSLGQSVSVSLPPL